LQDKTITSPESGLGLSAGGGIFQMIGSGFLSLPANHRIQKKYIMIQRIQSVFLLLAAASGFGLLATPIATTPEGVENSTLFSDSFYSVGDNPGLMVLFALAGVLALVSIFLFKNRQAQMKITRFAIIADVLGLVLAVLLFWQDVQNLAAAAINDAAGSYLPFAFLLFGILALRFMRKDERLVRSMDRLR
jgi:Domain of unknown function (DUF4293)